MAKSPNPRPKNDEDAELIEAINAGQRERFHELVKQYEGKLYNFGLRMCRDARDAEDLVQDTFLNVFRYLKTFRYETKFKNWLYRVAASTCLKKRRKSKFAPDRELSLEEFLPEDRQQMTQGTPGWASLPLDQLLNEELAQALKKSILVLPPKYRIIIVLRDMEGFTTAETAQILGITPSNVKVRLHRARLYLREQMEEYFKDGE
jgi:RNA polymerase sigma-70 factor (ECF subfamily)